MNDRKGPMTFVTRIEMMAENEVLGILGQARIMEIRHDDAHPCFVGFVAGHEGVTRKGRSERLGEVHQHWADDAIQSLADAFDQPRRGGNPIPCYWKHSDGSRHRKVVGQVEAARTVKRKGRWEAHTVCYIPEGDTRDKLKAGKIDICSPECEVLTSETATGGMEVVKVLKATGLAFGASTLGHLPAFGGATFTDAIQMFVNGDTQKPAEPKGRRPMDDMIIKSKEDLLLAISKFREAGILQANDLMNLPDVKAAFERESARDEAKSKEKSNENSNRVTGSQAGTDTDTKKALDQALAKLESMGVSARLPTLLNEVLKEAAGVSEGGKHNLTSEQVDGILGTIKDRKYVGADTDIKTRIAEDIKPALVLVNLNRSNASSETTTQKKTPDQTQGKKGGDETKTGSDHEGVISSMIDDSLLEASKQASGTQ